MNTEKTIACEISALEQRLAALKAAAAALRGSVPVVVPTDTESAPAADEPPDRPELPRPAVTGRVLRLVASGKATTSSAIRLATGWGHVEVAHALQALERRGLIQRTGRHGPRLNGRGRAPIEYTARISH